MDNLNFKDDQSHKSQENSPVGTPRSRSPIITQQNSPMEIYVDSNQYNEEKDRFIAQRERKNDTPFK